MSKNKKFWVVGIAIVVVGFVGWKIYSNQLTNANGSIKIGGILPLSGPYAQFGEAVNQGAILAVDEAKARGLDVQYINQDDQSVAVGSANAANALINDKIDAALTATVEEAKPAGPIFQDASIPLLVTWDSSAYVKSAGSNIFTIGFSTEAAGQKMAEYAYSELGKKTAAVISQKDEWSDNIAAAFAAEFKSLGGTVVFDESLQPNQKDFRTELLKIKNNPVGVVYFPFLPGSIAPFMVQASQLGVKTFFATGDSMSPDEVTQAHGTAEGLYFTNLYSDNGTALIEKYKTKYGDTPGDPIFVSMGYDGMNTLIAAARISRAMKISMADALRQVNIKGTDYQINFAGKQYSEKYERLYRVTNGNFVEISK